LDVPKSIAQYMGEIPALAKRRGRDSTDESLPCSFMLVARPVY
jgi:hypothetical protein